MTVSTFKQPNFTTTSDATEYKSDIDAAVEVLAEAGANFAAHEAATPDMTVVVDAGQLFTYTAGHAAIAPQITSAIAAPTTNPRIDRIALDMDTGALVIITGTEDVSPVAGDYSTLHYPICRLALVVSQTIILNTDITDERVLVRDFGGRKGADIASAPALIPGADGDAFDVTGTITITSIGTVGIGAVIRLHFDSALTLTHHTTDLILPGGANITTAAGDEAEFIEYAAGDWRCTKYTRLGTEKLYSGDVVQVVVAQEQAYASSTTIIPLDDTIPESVEGFEIMSVSITPKDSANNLIIEAVANLGHSVANANLTIALFIDSNSGASAVSYSVSSGGSTQQVVMRYFMGAGTTNLTTFKIRAGSFLAGTTGFNGVAGRMYGGRMQSNLIITEIKA